ncbi:MAG: cobalamin-binding protein [Candidatus Saganbacteria bacterium]|nr:cobalamin-binding protein [Candidatus Saganbacteria bacterium]
MKTKIISALLILSVFSGCGAKTVEKPQKILEKPFRSAVVIDESGEPYTAVHRPVRIISTMPSNTEILFALGLKDRIIGVTSQCNYPPEARKIKKIGGADLNIEQIISLNPDLIVMLGDAQKNDVERLRRMHLPVFVINPQTLPGLIYSINILGQATGNKKEARDLSKKMQNEIYKISTQNRSRVKPKVFVMLWHNPLITAGNGTFIDDLITLAGGVNIASQMGVKYPIMNFEELIEQDPDFLIIAGKAKDEITRLKTSPKWRIIKAVKENNMLLIDSDIITRPSPRLMTALDLITSFIQKREQK